MDCLKCEGYSIRGLEFLSELLEGNGAWGISRHHYEVCLEPA